MRGQLVTIDGQLITNDGQLVAIHGQLLTNEGQLVAIHGHSLPTMATSAIGQMDAVHLRNGRRCH